MPLPGSTDDFPIQITAPVYRPAGQSDLMSWLAKEAAGEIPNNENDSTVNYSDLYDSPEDRARTASAVPSERRDVRCLTEGAS